MKDKPKQESDGFTRQRAACLDAAALDKRLSAEAFRLIHIIASRFLNRQRGYAYPSQPLLADLLGVSERQIRNLLGELIGRGYLLKKRGGRGRANEYRIVLTGSPTSALTGSPTSAQPYEEPLEDSRAGRLADPPLTPSSTFMASERTFEGCSEPDNAVLAPKGSLASDALRNPRLIDWRCNSCGRYDCIWLPWQQADAVLSGSVKPSCSKCGGGLMVIEVRCSEP